MAIPLLYLFDSKSREFKGSRPAQRRPNGKPILDAMFATPDPPGPEKKTGFVQVYHAADARDWPYAALMLEVAAKRKKGSWLYIEDHRQHMDEQGTKQGGTPYWLPDDDWQTPARYVEDLGPLPAEAVRNQPQRPAPDEAELAARLREERDRRLEATDKLMFPDSTVSGLPLTDEQRQTLLEYRGALKTLPSKAGFPWNGGGQDDGACPWPKTPAFLGGKEVM